MIIQMWQNHCGLQGKKEEREEGNKKRRKDCFTAVLSKNNNFNITYIYPSAIFYIEAFKYISQ